MPISSFATPAQLRLGGTPPADSTAEAILGGKRLAGEIAIVTGGASGLGLETTRVLTMAGVSVIVPARSTDRAVQALESLSAVEVQYMDLAKPSSIDEFADGFLASGQPLHMLINCAGVMATPLIRDVRGYEGQLVAHHLGHFQLTVRLWPALVRAGGARVGVVTSASHHLP